MRHIRRSIHEPRVELTPLIDVVFLLLTFFIYAMLVTVEIDILPMKLRAFRASEPAKPVPAAVVSIDLDGGLFLDREPVTIEDLAPKLKDLHARSPETILYLAVADGTASIDRAPVLQDVWDRLKDAGLEINLVGRRKDGANGVPAAADE